MTLPKPYYKEKDITLYCGDCREIIPTLPNIDLILTDLPYGIELGNPSKGGQGAIKAKKLARYTKFDDTIDNLRNLIQTSLPLMKTKSRCVAIFSGIKTIMLYPQPDWIIAWIYRFGANFCPYGFNYWTPILVYGKDPYQQERIGNHPLSVKSDIIEDNIPPPKNGHPCPKPLSVVIKLLNRLSPKQTDLILDPFCGSGTTLVAAKKLGRKAIGIETEKKYCDITVKRLSQEYFS